MSSEMLLKNEFGYVELCSRDDDINILRFVHRCGTGSVSLYGGQVLSWQPRRQKEVFWLSHDSKYATTHAIRGGIPICWPWFGDEVKRDDGSTEKASNHGFARQSQWHIDDINISEHDVTIVISLSGEHYSNQWPAAFKLSQTLVFSKQFNQSLTITNLSAQPVEYTSALHSYFCISSPEQSHIPLLENARFDNKLSGEKNVIATLDNCKGPIDRIYYDSQQQRIIDKGWKREINIISSNCQQWVMWNPGNIADSMADMHQGSEQEFVCLEAANTGWQQLASQASITMSQEITISNLK